MIFAAYLSLTTNSCYSFLLYFLSINYFSMRPSLLTRPLAYKGPSDHLTQSFPLPLLYQGIKVLLQDLLMDWQYFSEEKKATGIFLFENKLIKTQLYWPISNELENNSCDCLNNTENDIADSSSPKCMHLAALAIECKMFNDRLPQPLSQNDHFDTEWQYLEHWIKQQNFDPFPNMARHRVIYIINHEKDLLSISLHKAYLTQKNEYQKKSELKMMTNITDKLPKFISLVDQQILFEIQRYIKQNANRKINENTLKIDPDFKAYIINKMANSQRLFWKTCHRQPLDSKTQHQAQPGYKHLINNLFIDVPNHQLISCDKNQVELEKFEKIKSFLESDSVEIIPHLIISSQTINFSWRENSAFELEIAEVVFWINNIKFNLQNLINWVSLVPDLINSNFFQNVASRLHQLDWLPSLSANFEIPVSDQFPFGTRYLSGNFSHWLPLIRGLQLEGWNIQFKKSFKLNNKPIEHWYHRVTKASEKSHHNKSNDGWFDLEVGIKVDGQSINIMPYIVSSLQQGSWDLSKTDVEKNLFITLEDGNRVELDYHRVKNILNSLLELHERSPLNSQQQLRLPINQLSRLKKLQNHFEHELQWQQSDWLKQKAESLSQSTNIRSIKTPENINAILRSYQHAGLNWLQFLSRENLPGILADDMGLGKTLQVLSHIQCEKNSQKKMGPCLVVAPTSLLGNWLAESNQFTPQLKTLLWSGSKRHANQSQLSKVDLIITSYGLLMRDLELFNQQSIYLTVLDEAQAIKNVQSKISKAAYAIRCHQRLCVTGTPMENHLGELWSLFNFLSPGFLGNQAQFKRLFQNPIEKHGDSARQQELTSRISPFILRRTKNKVATDLPEKTVIKTILDLEENQADIYEVIRLSMLDEVQKAISQSGKAGNQLIISNALLRLRQVCCHPGLIESIDSKRYPPVKEKNHHNQSFLHTGSAKLTWLAEKLPEMIENGRRILIFSSFTSMLVIIEDLLKTLSIKHLILTGKTKNRTQLVANFQQGETPVFLISLKAGGSGLNLTEADTVIHFDPWWNPAAENQASDRAHRIGQNKPVFIYKLITKGTVEEKISQMQYEKSRLANKIYRQTYSNKNVTQPDWIKLLAPLERN